jgi:outer membrane protein assembly factor BamC|tara:strand:- start:851 stop:1954 length:1104 start_codon:yes stop_codon:yes gene_type:complete
MRFGIRAIVIVIIAFTVTSCSLFGLFRDRENDYLKANTLPRTKIPEELDSPPFKDLMVIPEIVDSRGIAGQEFEVPVPVPLNTNFGVERIVIRRLGDARWIFLDVPPAAVWSALRDFWQSNNLTIAIVDPGRGLIETEWLGSQGGDAEQIFESLKEGRSQTSGRDLIKSKFQMRIEPGVRAGSSEIYLRYKQVVTGSRQVLQLDWSEQSDDIQLEDTVLSAIAYHLGERIDQSTSISLLAGSITNESRAVLVPDRTKPVLKYKLDFNRAWATVGAALDNARINVEDLDRTSAVYFVYYRDGDDGQPGFIRRLFMDEDERPAGEEDRYMIHLDQADDGVDVTILKDPTTLASAETAERILKIIKEYST